jgi:hypothetical protein
MFAMTVYFGLWKANTSLPPQDPKVEVQLNQAFHAVMQQLLKSGDVKEVNSFIEGGSGYFVSGDITDERLHEILLSWSPYVTFEVHKTVPALKTIEALIGIWKQRAAALTVPA